MASRLGGDAHVLEHGGAGKDIGDLGTRATPCRETRFGGSPVMSCPSNTMRPLVGRSTPVRQLKKVDLPGAVGADDGADLAPLHGHGHVVEGGEAAEPHRETLGAEDDRGRGAPAVAGRGLRR